MYGYRDHATRGDSPIGSLNQSPLGFMSKLHSNSRARFGVRPVWVSGILSKRHTGETTIVDKDHLLGRLDKAWKDFQESHAGLSDSQLLVPGVTGAWSVRDIIAHVTTWEEEALKHLPLILKSGRSPHYEALPSDTKMAGERDSWAIFGRTQGEGVMKNRQYSQFALLAMEYRKHNEHRHIRSAIRELRAVELDLKNDGNGTGVGPLTVLDRVHEALAELRGIDEQIQLGNTAIADGTSTT